MICFLQQWRNVARFEAGRHSAMLEATVELNINRKSYVLYRMVTFQMTF